MGRTLTYEIFLNQPLPRDTRREILLAQDMLNQHFTWTCEELSLEIFDEPRAPEQDDDFVYFADPKDTRPRIATGFTKVAGDEWSACVVTRFCRWLSHRLPDATVALRDEGDYILPEFIVFRRGDVELNEERIKRQRKYLVEMGLLDCLTLLDEAVRSAREKAIFFNSVSAWEYVDRGEIRALGLTDQQFTKATLEDVAQRLTWPWDTKWLRTAE